MRTYIRPEATATGAQDTLEDVPMAAEGASNRSERIPTNQIAPDTRPGMQQPRLLPLPHELQNDGEFVPQYRELAAELAALGESLKERQLQPIVVYPGTSAAYPGARFCILVGHRRWTAAVLVGLEYLDAVVVAPPEPAERVRAQYTENEGREEFSDIERMWTITQLRAALGNPPWDEVERQLGIGRARRQQLMRLSAFSADQQRQVALLRLQETQARPLHTALRSGALTSAQVDRILVRLGAIAAERAEAVRCGGEGLSPRRVGIDGPTVARLVARALRESGPTSRTRLPRWVAPLRQRVEQVSLVLQRAEERAPTLDHTTAGLVLNDLGELAERITTAAAALRHRRDQLEAEEDG